MFALERGVFAFQKGVLDLNEYLVEVLVLTRSLKERPMFGLTLSPGCCKTYTRSVFGLEQSVFALEGGVFAFEKGVLALNEYSVEVLVLTRISEERPSSGHSCRET